MGRGRRVPANVTGQLRIEWESPSKPVPPVLPTKPSPPVEEPTLVQVLPWDFRRSFPPPLPEAIEAGLLDETDVEPENLQSLHEDFAGQCLAILIALDALAEVRYRGIDPLTRHLPSSAVGRERLRRHFTSEQSRLDRSFDLLIGSYTDGFGADAADAFVKAFRARHAGILIQTEGDTAAASPLAPAPTSASMPPSPCIDPHEVETRRRPKRTSARLPVPKPLAEAIGAGRFGYEQDGRPVRPSAAEVREITIAQADKLIGLLNDMRDPMHHHAAQAGFEAALSMYAEDFGTDAAEQLRAYALRRAERERSGRGL